MSLFLNWDVNLKIVFVFFYYLKLIFFGIRIDDLIVILLNVEFWIKYYL